MSPEQTRGQVGQAPDIWAFGCVLFEMLAGRNTFSRKRSHTIAAILSGELDWSALPESTLPNAASPARCLTKDPRRR